MKRGHSAAGGALLALDPTDFMAYYPFMGSRDDTSAFLVRLAAAIKERRLRITWKADDEIAGLGWSRQDALDQLGALSEEDHFRTEVAKNPDFRAVWVFCPLAWELDRHLWIRLAERADHTFLISFHVSKGDPWT